MKKLLIFILMGFGMFPVFGQEESKHPIDLEMELCIKQDSTQSLEGVGRCEMAAMKSWKAEVDKNYRNLLAILPEPSQKKLAAAQKQWQAYIDVEAVFARGAYSDKERFQFGVVPLSRAIDLLRQRAIDLKEYSDILVKK